MALDFAEAIPRISSSHTDSGFFMSLVGRVESGQLTGIDSAVCSYQFVVGPDWQINRGHDCGETQLAKNQVETGNRPSIIWNFPIDVTFKSTNAFGWPRLVLTVREGSRAIKGYGSVYIPTIQGTHVRYCKLFSPCSSTRIQSVISNFMNEPPEFYDSRFVTANNGRQAARVDSSGVVKVTFMVTLNDLEKYGYKNGQ